MHVGLWVLIFSVVSILIGFVIGHAFIDSWWKKDCVKKGFAEYNNKTGSWQWKEKAIKQIEGE